ncbi:uroporphyrinogen-III synthase [Sneathiella glossodoripedis]|uniref:uroporphyrinogen-III synthase n=1 Tax=Sneathiella glossodoripedis TaxID=418853 RepID=UPI00046E7FA2|nr:uroporphyrinogen-III synthase [Sneathiella glossodoripedis]
MKLLVTRPLSASTELAATLMERGHSVICSPLLTVKFNENVALTFDGVQGLVVTSMNGVQGLARNTTERELPLYCVGDKTAQVSSELGFKNVHSANGDVNSLFDLVVREVDPSRGTLLHLGGARLAGDLKGLLEKAGYKYQREILYEAIDASKLNSNAVEAILDGSLNGVLLFSPHTAKVFCKLIDEPDLKAQIRHLTLGALVRMWQMNLSDASFEISI